jgi:hypothetical protein
MAPMCFLGGKVVVPAPSESPSGGSAPCSCPAHFPGSRGRVSRPFRETGRADLFRPRGDDSRVSFLHQAPSPNLRVGSVPRGAVECLCRPGPLPVRRPGCWLTPVRSPASLPTTEPGFTHIIRTLVVAGRWGFLVRGGVVPRGLDNVLDGVQEDPAGLGPSLLESLLRSAVKDLQGQALELPVRPDPDPLPDPLE